MNTIHKFYRAAITLIGVWSILFSAIQPSVVSAQQGKDGLKRQKNAQTGKVNFLGPETGRALPAAQALGLSFGKAHPADPALALAQHFAPEFGVKNPNQDLKEIRKNESKNGRITARYQQTYQDIPVMGGELIVNTNEAGDLYSVNGEVSQDLSLQTQPEIDSAQATQTALQAMAKWYQKTPADFVASEAALWIFDESLLQPSTRPPELVWRMEVTAKDNSAPVRELVLVNAQQGHISLHFNQVDSAQATPASLNQTNSLDPLAIPNAAPSIVKYEDLVVDGARNRVYGADKTGNKVDVINMTDLSVISSYSLVYGAAPTSLDLSPDGNELAIAQSGIGFVKFINLTDDSVTQIPSVLSGSSSKVTDVIYGRSGILYALTDTGLHVIDLTVSPHAEDATQYVPGSGSYDERFGAISADKNTLYYVTGTCCSGYDSLNKYDVSAGLLKPTLLKLTHMYETGYKRGIRVSMISNDAILTTAGLVYNTANLTLKAKNFQILPPATSLPGKSYYVTGYNNEGLMADALYFYDNETSHKLSSLSTGILGTLGAIAASNDGITLFVSSTGGMKKFVIGNTPPGTAVALPSSNHQYNDIAIDTVHDLAYGTDTSGRIDVIQMSTASVINSYLLPSGADPIGIDVSPDGDELAIALNGLEKILFINPATGSTTAEVTPQLDDSVYYTNLPYDVIYGRNGRLYSNGNPESGGIDYIHVIDTAAHIWVAKSPYPNTLRTGAEFAIRQDNNYLYANQTFSPNNLYIYDIQTDVVTNAYQGPHGPVYAPKFTIAPDGSKVFTSSGQVWDSILQSQLGTLQGAPGNLIEFIPGRDALVLAGSGGNGDVLKFIDANDYRMLSTYYPPYVGSIIEMEVSPDGNKLVINMSGGKIIVLDLSANFPPGELGFGPSRITYTANHYSSDYYLPGTKLCENNIQLCTGGTDPHADAAHKYAGGTWKFYFDKLGRDSIDNNGMSIVSSVHYGYNYANAYWNGTQMVYGDGYGFALADDVVAHELTHGVTQYESNLFYFYQSGAINESFSDVFGEYYDQTNGLGNDVPAVKWLLGEDISGLGANRDMKNPPHFGDPDKMTSSLYYKGLNDNGGVHTNSGVNNKAVYLMVDGGTFNGKTVTGLGWEKVGAIYYEVQTNLLSSGADYSDLYYALLQACTNLTSQHDIVVTDCQEVKDALDAVQMNASSSFNPDAPLCPKGMIIDPASTLFVDNLESGLGNWQTNGSPDAWSLEEGYASSSTHMLFGDDYYTSNNSSVTLTTGISIPTDAKAYLHFKHAYLFDYFNYYGTNYYFDGGVLEYSTNSGSTWKDAKPLFAGGKKYGPALFPYSGNPLGGRQAFVGDSHGYVSSLYNLSSLAGQTINFRWRLGTDVSVAFLGWTIDDIEVNTCVPIPAIPALQAPVQAALSKDYTPLLNWSDAVSGLYHYQVQVADENTFAAPLYDINTLNVSEYQIPSDLTPNTTYYWRVRSFNNLDATLGWSIVRSFRTVIVPPTLSAPADATQLDNRRPLFNWDDVAGATGYQFVLSKQANLGNPLKNIPVLTSEYLPPDLPANTLFYWWVMAKGPNGPSAWSSTHSFTTGNPASTPALVAPANNALVKDYTPLLDWKNSVVPAGTTFKYYELEADDNSDFSSPAVNANTTSGVLTDSSFTSSVLNPNTKYYWRVRSVNTVGLVDHFSGWSKVWAFRAAMLAPTLQSPTNGDPVGSLKPTLTWTAVTGATSYTIQIATSSSFGTIVLTKNSSTSDFTLVTNLPKNKTLYWRVRALGPNGPSDWSVPFSFHTPQ